MLKHDKSQRVSFTGVLYMLLWIVVSVESYCFSSGCSDALIYVAYEASGP